MAETAVVILNYNGRDFLAKFLPGVIANCDRAEVYVVDNNSSDDSVAFLAQNFKDVKLICFDENHGFTKGYNLALKQIDAVYYVLLNSDIEVTAHWISPVIDFMNEHPETAACQPKIKDYHNKEKFEYAGGAGGYLDTLGYPYCRGRLFDTLEDDKGQYDDVAQIFWASGACLFIRSEVFHEQEGFRDEFFAHMEEIDLCWRINLSGKKIYCIPQSTVYHVGGGTLSKSNPRKTYLNFRNNMAMLFVNSQASALIWKLPLKFVLDWLAAIKFWKDNSYDHFKAVVQAHYDFLGNWSNNMALRRKLHTSNSKTPLTPALKGFLPWQYFVLNKRNYADLDVD